MVFRAPFLAAKTGKGCGTTTAISEQALLARAKANAARRKAAVFVDPPTVPQPADAAHIREIAGAIRSWSAGEWGQAGRQASTLLCYAMPCHAYR